MKKLIAMILAFVLVFSLSTTAFADDNTETMGTGDKTLEVTASYNPAASSGTVYNVDITWDSMSFVYTETSARTWQPASHTYSDAKGSWNKTEAKITVANHSEAAVQVDVTYASTGDSGITGTITGGIAKLNAGEVGKPQNAASMTATLTISGTPNSSVTKDGVKIGTITIKIS